MADVVLSVKRRPALTGEAKRHPLATETGLNLMVHLLEADKVWSACTKRQRELLAELCPPVAERLLGEGELTAEQMPTLPDAVRSVSRAALERRGLVDEAGRLTGEAVHAWFYAGRLKANGGDHG